LRGRRLVVVAVGAICFLAVSAMLARWLATENRERSAVLGLLRAEARGDAGAMLDRLEGCAASAGCRAAVAANARELRRGGEVKILAYSSGTRYAPGDATGRTRVAWGIVDRGLPVVQCVDVRRDGSVLAGHSITLQRLSRPIGRESSC
jgi:hypothetical protein